MTSAVLPALALQTSSASQTALPMPLSAAQLWTESLEASASPTTSSAATWADEAVTAALALLPTPVTLPEEPGAEMEENDSPSTLETADDRENDETVAA